MCGIIVYFLAQKLGTEILLQDHFSGILPDQCACVKRLMVIGCKRERDKNHRLAHGGDFGDGCRARPANNQVCLFVQWGHKAKKCLNPGGNVPALISRTDHLLIRAARLMNKEQIFLLFYIIQGLN